MAKVIIFGVKDLAQLACYYLTNDSNHQVVAFSVDRDYLPPDRLFEGLPVVSFEEVEKLYEPAEFCFFAPISYRNMNRLRAKKYWEIKNKGYQFINYISSRATVLTDRIGDNCFILEDNTLQPCTKIGNDVILWSGNHIGHHTEIKDHVFVSSHVVIAGRCIIEPFCFLGINATVRDNITMAKGSLVGMSASIARDTEPWTVYKGQPATKSGHIGEDFDF